VVPRSMPMILPMMLNSSDLLIGFVDGCPQCGARVLYVCLELCGSGLKLQGQGRALF
jgi:hypothetical protein